LFLLQFLHGTDFYHNDEELVLTLITKKPTESSFIFYGFLFCLSMHWFCWILNLLQQNDTAFGSTKLWENKLVTGAGWKAW
jgi:hypothetical protein